MRTGQGAGAVREPAHSVAESDFARLFGDKCGREANAEPFVPIEPTRLDRAREFVAWINDGDWSKVEIEDQILLRKAAGLLGFGIEYINFRFVSDEDRWPNEEESSLFLMLYDWESSLVPGLVELTLGGASLLVYDQPVRVHRSA